MTDEPIRSLQNPRVKDLVRLRQARGRQQLQLTRIDGCTELERAMDAGLVPECLYVNETSAQEPRIRQMMQRAGAAGSPVRKLAENVYRKVRYGERDEGLCATVNWRPRPLAELPPSENALYLVLEGLEKPGNLGAVLRTADAAGIDAVILCDAAVDPTNPNAIRASLGTIFTVPLFVGSTAAAIEVFDSRGVVTASAVVGAHTLYTQFDYSGSCALVLGAEHDGLTARWRQRNPVGIPMAGRADSLNVSVTAAVMIFEAVRQRRAGP